MIKILIFIILSTVLTASPSISEQVAMQQFLLSQDLQQRRCGDCSCSYSPQVASCCPGGSNNQALLSCLQITMNQTGCKQVGGDCWQECYCKCSIALGCNCPIKPIEKPKNE